MSHVRKLIPAEQKLQRSTNAWVKDSQKTGWIQTDSTNVPTSDRLFVDIVRGTRKKSDESPFPGYITFNGAHFPDSDEGKSVDHLASHPNIDEAVKSFLTRTFFAENISQNDLDTQYMALKTFWNQTVMGFGAGCINASLESNYYTSSRIHARCTTLTFVEGMIFLDTTLSDINLCTPNDSDVLIRLPGFIKDTYILTNKGFKLLSVTASNSLLEEIILNEHVNLTPEKLAQAAAEENENSRSMQDAIEAYKRTRENLKNLVNIKSLDENSLALSRPFLKTGKTLYDKEKHDFMTIKELTNAMASVCALIESEEAQQRNIALKNALRAATSFSGHPWGGAFSRSMLNYTNTIHTAATHDEYNKTHDNLLKKLVAIQWPDKMRRLGMAFLHETNTLRSQTNESAAIENLTIAMNSVCELLVAKTRLEKDVALQKISASYATLNHTPWSRTLSTLLWNLASAILAVGSVLATSTGIGAPIGVGLGVAAAATSLYGTGLSLFSSTPVAKAYDELANSAVPAVKVAT